MYTVIFNDSTTHDIYALPWETVVTRRGKDINVVCVPCDPSMTLVDVKEMFEDPVKTNKMVFTENGYEVRAYQDYIKLQEICWVSGDDSSEDSEEEVPGYFVVKLSQAVAYDAEILNLKKTITALNGTIESLNKNIDNTALACVEVKNIAEQTDQELKDVQKTLAGVDPDTLELPELKEYLTAQSKKNLEEYLASNPVTSFVHGDVGKRYAITAEKQQHLMAMILTARNAEEMRTAKLKEYFTGVFKNDENITFEEFVAGVDDGSISTGDVVFNKYQASWNATGEPCTYDWTLSELVILAAEIEAVVRPLISKQQEMEVAIKNAGSIDVAKKVKITF